MKQCLVHNTWTVSENSATFALVFFWPWQMHLGTAIFPWVCLIADLLVRYQALTNKAGMQSALSWCFDTYIIILLLNPFQLVSERKGGRGFPVLQKGNSVSLTGITNRISILRVVSGCKKAPWDASWLPWGMQLHGDYSMWTKPLIDMIAVPAMMLVQYCSVATHRAQVCLSWE